MPKTLAMKFGLASGGKRTISVSDVKDDLNAETTQIGRASCRERV